MVVCVFGWWFACVGGLVGLVCCCVRLRVYGLLCVFSLCCWLCCCCVPLCDCLSVVACGCVVFECVCVW